MLVAGSTATTEVVRALGFIVSRRRSVEDVGLVIDIAGVVCRDDSYLGMFVNAIVTSMIRNYKYSEEKEMIEHS